MSRQFRLPDLGEGLTEAEIVQWLVAPGDAVALNQNLAEVETAKAIVELPSPYEGTIAALHAQPGDTVAVGAPLISFDVAEEARPSGGSDDGGPDGDESGQDAAGDHRPAEQEPGEQQAPPASANLVGYGAAPVSGARPRRRARRVAAPSSVDTAVLEAAPHDVLPPAPTPAPSGERPRSTPPVRAHAKRLGVDLALVAAEVGGRLITREDVDAYAQHRSIARGRETDAAVAGEDERETRTPIRGVRKRTAEVVTASAFTAPHVTCFHTVDVTATMELIASLRADRALEGHRIGLLAVVAKAVCLALARTPELNARWDADADEIVHRHHVDLGIAVATERGLIVPMIRDAHRRTLVELADDLADLTTTARSGQAKPTDLAGGTFSITNIGVFGIDGGTPILPPGHSGILATGAVREQAWVHRGELAVRQVMTLSLSFDHRLVDGAEGARFLKDVADVLEEPGRAMLRA